MYKLKNPMSAGAGKALMEQSKFINDWALEYADYIATQRAKVTGYAPTVIRADIEEAARIVERNRKAVEKDK